MAVSTCLRSKMYGGRKRSTVSLVQLITIRRFSISATVSLARSAESSSAASIRPLPRTSLMASCREARMRLEVVAHFGRVFEEVLFFDRIDHRNCNGTGQRSTAKSRPMHSCVDGARSFFGTQDRTERDAASEGLGEGGHIRLDTVVLVGAPFASAAHARLDFVDNE